MKYLALLLSGCAASAAVVRPPGEPRDELTAVEKLIADQKLDEADARLAGDRAAYAGDEKLQDRFAYDQAVVRAWRRDYAGAGKVLEARLGHGDSLAIWNTLTWVRWAAGDLDGAVAANENLRGGDEGWLGHYWWDRAYLHVDRAYRRPAGPERARALAIADEARTRFAGVAHDADPVHVLACYFAQRAGDVAAAAREADQVSDEWPDLQDAYIMLRAYELAGEPAKAERLRQKLQRGTYIMVPIYLQRLERDHDMHVTEPR